MGRRNGNDWRYSPGDDKLVFRRLANKTLFVNRWTGAVWSIFPNRDPVRLKPTTRSINGSSYNFVTICHKGFRKKYAVHRLVWMSVNRRTVPAGYDVHHKNGKHDRYPDRIKNLELLTMADNRSRKDNDPPPF